MPLSQPSWNEKPHDTTVTNHKYTGAWLLDAIIFYKKENSCFWQVAEGYEWYIKCFVSLTSAFLVASGSEQYTKALFNFSLNIDKQI